MHIIAILGAIAAAIYYLNRISKGASAAADTAVDTAQTLRNLPRKRRFQKHARASGLDLVEGPLEAATMLMLACAALGLSRNLTHDEREAVMNALRTNMECTTLEADDLVTQIGAMLHDVNQPESAVLPMTRILAPALARSDAMDLSAALADVAAAEGGATEDQARFLYSYRERMGLL